jgi:fructose/tagatose bisphosphate aldolase
LAQAFTGAVRDVLNGDGGLVDPRKYMSAGRNAQMEVVRERMQFIGASGKAN